MHELIEKRTQHKKYFSLDKGKIQVVFSPDQHYLDADGKWKDVDTVFHKSSKNSYVLHTANVVIETTQSGIRVTHEKSKKVVEWFYGSSPQLSSNAGRLRVTQNPFDWEIIPTRNGIKLEATVHKQLGQQSIDIPFATNGITSLQEVDGSYYFDDVFIVPKPIVIGADEKEYNVASWSLPEKNVLRLSIDDSVLPAEAYPYILDPTTVYNALAASGYIRTNNRTYGQARNGSNATLNQSTNTIYVGQTFQSTQYFLTQGYLAFDTSDIPDDAIIEDVELEMYLIEVGSSTATSIIYATSETTWGPTLATTDWSVPSSTDNSATLSLSSSSSVNQYYTFTPYSTFNNSINKTGITYYNLFSDRVLNNVVSTADTEFRFHADNGTNPPKLTVTYSLPFLEKSVTDTDAVFITESRNLVTDKNATLTDTNTLDITEDTVLSSMYDSAYGISNSVTTWKALSLTDTSKILSIDTVFYLLAPEPRIASIDDTITGKAGPLKYAFGMRYYNNDFVLLDDISNYVRNVRIAWDSSQTTKLTITFDYDRPSEELSTKGYVEPYVILELPSPDLIKNPEEEISLGFYGELSHRLTIGLAQEYISYTGYDRMFLLLNKTVNTIYSVPAGASYTTTIRNLCIAAGFNDQEIILPISTVTTPTALTWEPGTTYYKIVEQLCDSINWESPYIGFDNKFYATEMIDLNYLQPDVVYATDEQSIIIPDITHVHEFRDIINRSIISIADPLRTPFVAEYTNNNVNNAYSYTNTGELITKLYEDLNHLASSTIANNRAKYILQRESAPHTMTLQTWLDFRRGFYESYHIFIDTQANQHAHVGVAWRCTSWSMELTIGGTMQHTLKEIMEV